MNQFIQTIARKIGIKGAIDLNRDSRITALEKLLIKKGITTKEELLEARRQEETMIERAVMKAPLGVK